MSNKLEPSNEWLEDQMVYNLKKVFRRYCNKIEPNVEHSDEEIKNKIDALDENEQVAAALKTMDTAHYPPSQITEAKLKIYIRAYLSND